MFTTLLALLCLSSSAHAGGSERPWGATLDIGVPDAVNLGVAYRPIDPIRLSLTGGTNGIGVGGRVGIAVKVPWDVAPVLAVEAGHYLESDANWVVVGLAGEGAALPVFERIGYTYANGHAGLEFGNPKATFYVHGGMSAVFANVKGLQALVDKEAGPGALRIEDGRLTVYAPSARIGFIVYFKGRS